MGESTEAGGGGRWSVRDLGDGNGWMVRQGQARDTELECVSLMSAIWYCL